MPERTGMLTAVVEYDAPVAVAYAYLADPRNRPEWQSSLQGVEILDEGEPRAGMRWLDLTAAGIRPAMEITRMEPDSVWEETGRWRGISADLALRFWPLEQDRCRLEASFAVRGRGLLAPVGWAATRAGLFAVRSDLRKAGRHLTTGAR